MSRSETKILKEVYEIMCCFTHTKNEDTSSTSFFEAELNEDQFYILRAEIFAYLETKGATP